MPLKPGPSRWRLLESVRRTGLILIGALLAFLLVVVLLFAVAPRAPETPERVASVPELESFLATLAASGNPPSVSIAVVRGEAVVYRKVFGLADGPRRIEATPETVYRWYSLTKVVTAIAVLQLHERRRLDLDDPVEKHLPFFRVTFRGEQASVTIRNLLNHSSGLRDLGLDVLRWTHPHGRAARPASELLREALPRFSRLRFEPGSRAVYSNFGYLVLGVIIEEASGQSYESFVRDHVFAPLSMEGASFVMTEELRPRLAAGSHPVVDFQTLFLPVLDDLDAYVREVEDSRIWFEPFELDVAAYGGAMGSATDAALLLRAFLSETPGLQKKTFEKMLLEGHVRAGASAAAPPDSIRAGMQHGLGWWVFPGVEGARYEHTGAGPGFASIARLYPERSLGIVILANGTVLDRDGIADLVAQLF